MAKRKGLRVIGTVLLVAVLAVPAGMYAWRWYGKVKLERHVRETLGRWRSHPSAATAQAAVDLLAQRLLTADEANRLLGELTRPEVIQRSSYPVDGPVYVKLRFPYELELRDWAVAHHHRVLLMDKPLEDETWYHGLNYEGALGLEQRELALSYGGEFTRPGVQRVVLEFRTQLRACDVETEVATYWDAQFPFYHRSVSYLSLPPDPDSPVTYEHVHRLAIDVVIQTPEKAEKVARVQSPDLDAAVARAVTASVLAPSSRTLYSAGWRITGGVNVQVGAAPCVLAWRSLCLDESGKPLDGESAPFMIVRMGESRADCPSISSFSRLNDGVKQGFVELSPDVESAYKDPEIKEIWGGTIRFPVTCTVQHDKPASAPAP